MASYANTIEQAALSILQALSFSGVDSSNVVARALPRVGEVLAPQPPCVILAAGKEEEVRRRTSFEGTVAVKYPFEVALVMAGNHDFSTASWEASLREYREQIRTAFRTPGLVGGATVIDTEVRPGQLFDRSQLASEYVYSSMVLTFTSHETE